MGAGDRVKQFGRTDQPRPLVDRADSPCEQLLSRLTLVAAHESSNDPDSCVGIMLTTTILLGTYYSVQLY